MRIIIKYIYVLIFALFVCTSNLTECASLDSTNTPQNDLEALVRTFNYQEIEELNRILNQNDLQNVPQATTNTGNSLINSLLIFVAFNVAIIVVARYGITIFQELCSLGSQNADTLLETARQAAVHRVNTLLENPNNVARVQNAILRVAQLRQGNISPMA